MNKRLKAYVAGFLTCLMVTATFVWANPGGVMREVFFGVQVVVDGVELELPSDMAPFIMDNRTFLPVRGIAEALDVPVEWDGDTTTVYIGQRPTPRIGRTHLDVSVMNLPRNLAPAASIDTTLGLLHRQIYSTLLDMDYDTMEVLPSLAIGWHMPDAQTVNMELRRGVTFHNGAPLTAYDVQFSLERAAEGWAVATVVGMISHVAVHDNYNFTIHLTEPFAPILRHLTHPVASIINMEAAMEFSDGWEWCLVESIGTGPFMLYNHIVGYRIELVRNPNYWGDISQIENLTISAMPGSQVRLSQVATGNADIALGILPADAATAEASRYVTLMRGASLHVEYIGFNMSIEPWNNPLVVQAINYALETSIIIDELNYGVGTLATAPLSDLAWGFAEAAPFTTNIGRARELLAEAGYADGFDRTIEIWCNWENLQRRNVAEIMQFNLSELGITANINMFEWGEYVELTAEGMHDIFILGWGSLTGDPDHSLFPLFHSQNHGAAGNRTFHDDPILDALLEAGRAEINPTRRAEIYAEALQRLRDYPSMIPFRQTENLVAVSNDLRGLTLSPAGQHRFATVYFVD